MAGETSKDPALSEKMAEDLQFMKNRLEEMEKKFQELSNKQEKPEKKVEKDDTSKSDDEDQSKEEKKENKKEEKKGEEKKEEEKKKDTDLDDDDTPLTAKLNRLSWTQWRKMRVAENDWENMTDEQRKKEAKKRSRVKSERFVIDVVADTGDLGLKRSKVPGRIRINSEHILDALNNLINIALPQKCQILHPYKIIIDNQDGIRDHMKTLEDELAQKELHQISPVEGPNDTEKPKTQSVEVKSTKAKKDEDVELVQEKIAHYKCFIELLDTDLAPELEVARAVRDGTAEKIMFCHLWHLFPPGETVYHQNSDRNEPPQAAQVLKVSGGRPKLPNASRYYNVSFPFSLFLFSLFYS